ncbi:MAG: hypothetical protein CMI09_10910 [Oceanospirillaceae bacterium]|nr:hypothetical protein [Oceanospirillaceae bacterium]|tara:strand:- start:1095 stop:2054 length:960 start_codon:yes stop_codon:yes gene_type:complete
MVTAGTFMDVSNMPVHNPICERLQTLNTATVSGKRAPHKPLLILVALGEWQRGHRVIRFADIEKRLIRLLKAWAPPIKSAPNATKPWWHLKSDGLWHIHDLERLALSQNIRSYRQSTASFSNDVLAWLDTDTSAIHTIAGLILQQHFLPTTYQSVLDQCGLDIPAPFELESPNQIKDSANAQQRYRAASFRHDVLKAYDYRCAVSGFQITLGGSAIACEAAHIQAHAFNGPDTVDNGLALEPTLHTLFDRGIWSLSDDHRILISQEFSGSDIGLERIRSLSGQRIREPLAGQPKLNVDYIRWHREAERGGIFRAPALPW